MSAPYAAAVVNADVTAPPDPIVAVEATAGQTDSIVSTNSPSGQEAVRLFDNDNASKYLNFTKTGAGVIVTPLYNGPLTTVNAFRVRTGGDAPERDPVSFTIEGTNDRYASSTLHSSWTLLYNGTSGLSTDPGRGALGPQVGFVNVTAYRTYRILVTGVRNAGTANSFQMSELELIGSTASSGASFVVNATSDESDAVPGNGVCSTANANCTLRAAVEEANAHGGQDFIGFSVGGAITLGSALPNLTTDIVIDGPGANVLTVQANGAGEFRIFNVQSGATVQIAGLTISGGSAPGGAFQGAGGENGGAIYNAGTAHLVSVAVTGSHAGNGQTSDSAAGGSGGLGGGIFNAATMTITNSTIADNLSGEGGYGATSSGDGGSGGGIANSGTLTITNCTIAANQSGNGEDGGSGGGIYNTGTLTLTTSTVVSNELGEGNGGSAGTGGDIRNAAGTFTLRSTLTNDISGQFNSEGFTLLETAGVTLNETANPGTNIIGVSANVSELADNGGPTQTCAIDYMSPAYDHGKNFATDFSSNPIATDQRGRLRVDDTTVANAPGGDGADIGAFELPVNGLTVNSLADTDDGTCDAIHCTLREALNAATATYNGINITVTGTIDLAGALPSITHNTSIAGPGASQLTVHRNTGGSYRIFTIDSPAVVSISGLTVSNGHTPDVFSLDEDQSEPGGGILNSGTLALTGVVVTGNSTGNMSGSDADAGAGGGIYNQGTLTLTNCSVTGNSGGSSHLRGASGGGIASDGTLTLINTTVSGNVAGPGAAPNAPGGHGGGLYVNGQTTLTNSTLSGNSAGTGGESFNLTAGGTGGDGGGLYGAGGNVTVTSCTITNNHGGSGGGGVIHGSNGRGGGSAAAGSTITVRNTIIAGNTILTINSGDVDTFGGHSSSGYNIIGVQNGGFTQPTDQSGTIGTPLNPMLGALASNGGATSTHALLTGSPALDKGSKFGLATDQRGVTRPQDYASIANTNDGSDIGAYESTVPPVVVSIVRASANPAPHNSSVSFTVTFSIPVVGVDTSDFALTVPSGSLSGKSISGVTGSGATYHVAVNTGTGNGTLRLDVIDNDSIVSDVPAGPQPLGGAGAGNGNFTTGESFNVFDPGSFSSLIVTKTADTNDGTCNSDCSLREAIAVANADAGPETITFAIPAGDPGCVAGVCTIDIASMASDPDGLSSAFVIAGDLTITGPGPAQLTIRRNGSPLTPQFRLFKINTNVSATFSGLTLQNGYAPDDDSNGGGGILVIGSATLTNCVLTGNHVGPSSSFGGGAINVAGNTLTMTDCVVSGNVAEGQAGGGLWTGNGPTTLTRTTIANNVAGDGRGGGVYASVTGVMLTMVDCTVSGNHTTSVVQAADGGGVFALSLTMTGCTLNNNYTADGAPAPGPRNAGRGGAISVSVGTITNSTISGNHTGQGSNRSGSVGGNGGDGGGIFASFPVTITSCTITGNSTGNGGSGTPNGNAGNGGGIAKVNNPVNIRNTIIAGNSVGTSFTPGTGPDVFRTTTAFTSDGFNLIGVSNGDFTQPTDQTGVADPRLGSLANNGGPTQTHKPLGGSPAIDQGSSFGLATDQRGLTRTFNNPAIASMPGGDGTDVGAFEIQTYFGPTNLVATATGPSSVNVTWDAMPGASYYTLQRIGGSGTQDFLVLGNSYTDGSIAPDTAYLYRVRMVSSGNEVSDFSSPDLANSYTDDLLIAGEKIQSAHLTKIQTVVNSVRSLAGLGAATFTGGTKIQAAHVTELRSALASAFTNLGLPAPTYTNTPFTGALIRALDFKEIRNAMK